MQSLAVLKEFNNHTRKVNAFVSIDDTRLASVSDDTKVIVWDSHALTPHKTLDAHQGKVMTATRAKGSPVFYTASWDTSIKVWSCDKLECLRELKGYVDSVSRYVGIPRPCCECSRPGLAGIIAMLSVVWPCWLRRTEIGNCGLRRGIVTFVYLNSRYVPPPARIRTLVEIFLLLLFIFYSGPVQLHRHLLRWRCWYSRRRPCRAVAVVAHCTRLVEMRTTSAGPSPRQLAMAVAAAAAGAVPSIVVRTTCLRIF